MRDGWKPDSTWIEFDCGPYLAKHQHLDQNQITIYHNGYLAIDSGADYTDSESPHYHQLLPSHRRSQFHIDLRSVGKILLVAESSGGGQRRWPAHGLLPLLEHDPQPSRFRAYARSVELGNSMRIVDHVPGQYHYAMGDASNAYSR